MQYNLSYEVTALIFLVCVAAHFFTKKSYPSQLNTLFGLYLICGMADIVLDICGVFLITNAIYVPLWLNYAVNIAYYLMQMLMPYLLYIYVLTVTERLVKITYTHRIIMNAGLVIISLIIVLTPLTHMIFYFDESYVYSYGEVSFLTYIFSTGYVVATDVALFRGREMLTRRQFLTILSFTVISGAAIVLQFTHNEMLVTGVAMAVCITLLYLALQNSKHMTDELTQLLDRHSFDLHIREQLLSKNRKCYILIASISDVKSLDMTLGMRLANDLIAYLASRVKTEAEQSPCFRLNSDQFAVVCRDKENARDLAGRLALSLNRTQSFSGYDIATSGRVAYMQIPCQSYTLDEIMHLVEHMSDMARESTREREICIDKAVFEKVKREDNIVASMREALNGSGLDIYLQPMYSPRKGRFVEAEALLRFTHPSLGAISPDECIPLAERNGLMIDLGEMVLRRVCEYEKEYSLSRAINFVSINVSEAEMLREDGAERVLSILNEFNVNPCLIRFELTESIATSSYGGMARNMRILHDKGVTFSLDDFGQGYANFDSFMLLPFDAVKIDKSILQVSCESARAKAVMASIIKMIHDINVSVVVEGAESMEQVQMLMGMDVDTIQGFFYTQAIPIKTYMSFMNDNTAPVSNI